MSTVIAPPDNIQQFSFSVDLLKAVLWQYDKAPNLISLLNAKNAWYVTNQTEFWQSWLTDVFDLRTANQFGLAVWGIILGLPLYVNTAPSGQPIWGFGGVNGAVNFGNGNFSPQNGSSHPLPLNIQRIALQLRYTQLTCAGCVPEVNRALKWIFAGFGAAHLVDYGNMTQEYVFQFPLTSDLKYLFNNFDILPRPAGVASSYVDATVVSFGFRTTDSNFSHGNFGA